MKRGIQTLGFEASMVISSPILAIQAMALEKAGKRAKGWRKTRKKKGPIRTYV